MALYVAIHFERLMSACVILNILLLFSNGANATPSWKEAMEVHCAGSKIKNRIISFSFALDILYRYIDIDIDIDRYDCHESIIARQLHDLFLIIEHHN